MELVTCRLQMLPTDSADEANFGAKFSVSKPVVYWRHDTDTGDGVTIDNINVEETVWRVAELIAAEKELSPALKGSLEALMVSLLLNRLGLNSKNSSKPPSADPFRKKEPRSARQTAANPVGNRNTSVSCCDRWPNPTSSNPL